MVEIKEKCTIKENIITQNNTRSGTRKKMCGNGFQVSAAPKSWSRYTSCAHYLKLLRFRAFRVFTNAYIDGSIFSIF